MWFFKKKKKKIYKVEYKDEFYDYGCAIVKATDKADAWEKARKLYKYNSVYQPMVCLNITELIDD